MRPHPEALARQAMPIWVKAVVQMPAFMDELLRGRLVTTATHGRRHSRKYARLLLTKSAGALELVSGAQQSFMSLLPAGVVCGLSVTSTDKRQGEKDQQGGRDDHVRPAGEGPEANCHQQAYQQERQDARAARDRHDGPERADGEQPPHRTGADAATLLSTRPTSPRQQRPDGLVVSQRHRSARTCSWM